VNNTVRTSNVEVANGTIANYTLTGLSNYTYYWTVTCWDLANNTNVSETRRFSINTEGPIAGNNSFCTVDEYGQREGNISLVCNVTSIAGLDTCILYGNFSGEWKANSSLTSLEPGLKFTFPSINNLANGSYGWNIWCNDTNGLGQFIMANRTFYIDGLNPWLTLIAPIDGYNATTKHNLTFIWSANDDLDPSLTCNLTINNLVNVSGVETTNGGNGNATVFGFNEGNYTWNVTCADQAKNSNTTPYYWNYYITLPFTFVTNGTVTDIYGIIGANLTGVYYNNSISAVQLSASSINGTFISQIIDQDQNVRWKNISWISNGIGELPSRRKPQVLLNASIQPIDMERNLLLMHFNNDTLFGENNNIFYDFSGNSSGGYCSGNACPTFNSTSAKKGLRGNMRFDGINDSVVVPDSDSLNIVGDEISYSFWVKGQSQGPNRYIITKGKMICPCNGTSLFTGDDGELYFGVATTSGLVTTPTFDFNWDDSWHYVAGVYNSTNVSLYVDANRVASKGDVSPLKSLLLLWNMLLGSEEAR